MTYDYRNHTSYETSTDSDVIVIAYDRNTVTRQNIT